MIGVFDSGVGGLVILRELDKAFPEYDFVYFGDTLHSPYGNKSPEQVFEYTLKAVEHLFGRGCELVVLACNTASAVALRKIQQEVLPVKYPGKRVLGILVPTVEQVTGVNWIPEIQTPASTGEPIEPVKSVAVFATAGTVRSHAYANEIKKRQPLMSVFEIACPNLATMIEQGEGEPAMAREIGGGVEELKKVMGNEFPPEAVLLGCTHFPLVHQLFVKALPVGVHIYDQGQMVAKSLATYLDHHREIDEMMGKVGERIFLTTGDAAAMMALAEPFYGKREEYEKVTLAP